MNLTFLSLLCAADPASAPVLYEGTQTEDLMSVFEEQTTVLTASKHVQRIEDVAASITVVTSDDIIHFGYTHISEILRMAGILLTDNYEAGSNITIRGVGRKGSYLKDFLVLIDGHMMNESWSHSVNIDQTIGIDILDVRKVEILRGPASAIYGPNGFLGVINILSKVPSKNAGEVRSFITSAGTIDAGMRTEVLTPSGVSFFSSLSGLYKNGQSYSFPERAGDCVTGFAPSCQNGVSSPASNRGYAGQGLIKLGYKEFELRVNYHRWHSSLATAPFQAIFNDPRNTTTNDRGFAELSWHRKFNETFHLHLRGYYDGYEYGDQLRFTGTGDYADAYDYKDLGKANGGGGEARLEVALYKHPLSVGNLIVGMEGRGDYTVSKSGVAGAKDQVYVPVTQARVGVYAQAEITLTRYLLLIAGARYDYSILFHSALNPRAAIIFMASENDTIKLIYNRGYRDPSPFEGYYRDGVSVAENRALRPERSDNFEVMYRRRITPGFNVQVSGFVLRGSQILEQTLVCFDPSITDRDVAIAPAVNDACAVGQAREQHQNLASFMSYGGEFNGQLALRHFRAYANLVVQKSTASNSTATNFEPESSPLWMTTLGVSVPVLEDKLFLGAEFIGVADRRSNPLSDVRVPAYGVFDINVTTNQLTQYFDLQAKVSNLFDTPYFGASQAANIVPIFQVPQQRRTFLLMLRAHL